MAQYIDKDALVAEIEKLKADILQKKSQCKRKGLERIMHQIGAYNKVISLINTLEVKEVQKEPKFKIGDVIRFKGNETLEGEEETHKIVGYDNELYIFDDGTTDLFCEQELYELVKEPVSEDLESVAKKYGK